MRPLFGMGLVLALAAGAAADDKKPEKVDGKLLIGRWVAGDQKPPRLEVEYAAGGKLTGVVRFGEKELPVTGTYKLDGNKLTQTTQLGGKEQARVITITKLTETELVGEWDDGKQKETFRRAK